ncbi:MAG: hypothetical protein Q8K58_06290 [Acidimicrobiales bacterium]|nr:hypothetical protein [Acidimicrobiales bacterium]
MAVALAALGSLVGLAPDAGSASRWASVEAATIHPGVVSASPVGQCSTNFVFFQGAEVFIGQAAHCTGLGEVTDTNGCDAGSLPLGTPIVIEGASQPGTLAYSSWLAMQEADEKDPNACAFNDFALVRLHPDDRSRVNPTMPHWGGPTGVNWSGTRALSAVYSYGSSPLRQGLTVLSPKAGPSLGSTGGGWTHLVYTLTPGIPGDSGSGMLDATGKASGVLSTLGITPLPATNYFTDMNLALGYADEHGMPGLLLALGTTPFNPNQLPLG